jgi:hypothetical protein
MFSDPDRAQRWPQYHIWLLEKLRGLHKAFSHRVRFLETTEHPLDGIPRGLTVLPQFTVGDLSLLPLIKALISDF